MEQILEDTIIHGLQKFVEKFQLEKGKLVNEGETFFVNYHSAHFSFTVEIYWRTVNVTLFKNSEPSKRINLFNLINYITPSSNQQLLANYYEDETNLNNCYKKQINDLTNLIAENFIKISSFFSDPDFDVLFANLEADIIRKYPNLFRT